MNVHRVEMTIGGKTLSFETGRFARLADGAVVARFQDTVVLATAVSNKDKALEADFVPLVVDYQEKAFAAGKIPGGFFKREGKLGEKEILSCRLIDRPIRPLFPKGYCYETQVIATVLSIDKGNCSDLLGINASSAALTISDIPFNGPIGAVRVGRIDGRFVINPGFEEIGQSDLDIVVAGTRDAVLMVEGGAREVSEQDVLDAIYTGHDVIKDIIALQERLAQLAGKAKVNVEPPKVDQELKSRIAQFITPDIKKSFAISSKNDRRASLSELSVRAVAEFAPDADAAAVKQVKGIVQEVIKSEMREHTLKTGLRIDGRGVKDIRPITCEVSVLPTTHGSALFTRGETQSLGVITLGTSDDEQRLDTIDGDSYKSFLLHYNFPPFSVNEVKPMRGPGRREIGHGALAERALKVVIPQKNDFNYTIRIVSEVLESNGSSSMATVCSGTLSLMDAGVPIIAPVSGIAMGLIKEGDRYAVLSDILGDEDHLGDMDFKVAGTENGITALQMDMKIEGISKPVMMEALLQAKEGRALILSKMLETLPSSRETLSENAPKIISFKIKQDKIREVIGPGGKIIRDIIDKTGVKIDIDDDGTVNIFAVSSEAANAAVAMVKRLSSDPMELVEIGKIYKGKVVKIADFGAFVEIMERLSGLVHISQLAEYRVENVKDILKEGDEVVVKVIGIDDKGRIKLSRKEAIGMAPGE